MDANGDGMDDFWQASMGASAVVASADSDGDGFSDGDELDAGTDPLSANDVPADTSLNIILIKAVIDAASPP